MKAIIVNVSVVVGLLAPVHFDSHARHKHVEGRVKKMLGYFVVQRGVGGVGKICFERSMYLFREHGVKIVVVELGSGVNSIRRNLKEARVVLAARAAKGIKFPKSGGHKERGVISHKDRVVAIEFHLSLHVWKCVADRQGGGRPCVACGKVLRVQVCVALEIITRRGAGVPA
jgi:hypothetical protein